MTMRSLEEAAEIARIYLLSDDPDERQALSTSLDAYEGDLEAVLAQVRPKLPDDVETGLIMGREFRTAHLAKRNRGETFSLYVPEGYHADRSYGLIVFLHGGGHSMPRDTGNKVFDNYGVTDLFSEHNSDPQAG